MGLDIVELILAVEDGFQIHISDEEAGRVATVGDLNELVVGKLRGQDAKRCLTSAAFYRTRRAMVDTLGIERRQIAPSTQLEALLPRVGRREKWARIQTAAGLKLPPLRHSGSTAMALLGAGVAITVMPGIVGMMDSGWMPFLFILGLVVGGLLMRMSPSLAVEFPKKAGTAGDLTRDVLAANYARLSEEVGSWNRQEVWESLCRLIVEQVGVAREEIKPEALIVRDLGIE